MEGRWKTSESSKERTCNNPECTPMVSRKLTNPGKIKQKHPGQSTVWGQPPYYRPALGVGICQWFSTIGGLGRPRLRVVGTRPVSWGGGLSGTGSTMDNEKQRPVSRLSYDAGGASPPTPQRIIIAGKIRRHMLPSTTFLSSSIQKEE